MHGVLLLNTVRQHVEETRTNRSTPTYFASWSPRALRYGPVRTHSVMCSKRQGSRLGASSYSRRDLDPGGSNDIFSIWPSQSQGMCDVIVIMRQRSMFFRRRRLTT